MYIKRLCLLSLLIIVSAVFALGVPTSFAGGDEEEARPWRQQANDSYRIVVNPDPKWEWKTCEFKSHPWGQRLCLERGDIVLELFSLPVIGPDVHKIAEREGYKERGFSYSTVLKSGQSIKVDIYHLFGVRSRVDKFFLDFCIKVVGIGPYGHVCGLAKSKKKVKGGYQEFEDSIVQGVIKRINLVQQNPIERWTVLFKKSALDPSTKGGHHYKKRDCIKAAYARKLKAYKKGHFEATSWCKDTKIPVPAS